MDFQANMNNLYGHHHPQTSSSLLCARGCGFYGTTANGGLCSKCYLDHLIASHSPIGAVSPVHEQHVNSIESEEQHDLSLTKVACGLRSLKTRVDKSRCEFCKKKVGLLGFACRCGGMFCGSHRYPEGHICDVDLKKRGRIDLAKENPLLKADKLKDRI